MSKNNKAMGIIMMLISSLCFAFMGLFVQLAGELPAIEKSFFRNIVAFIVALVILFKERKDISIQKNDIPLLFLRCLFGTIGVFGNFYALNNLILSDASTLNKLSPFFTVIFAGIFLKEKLSFKKVFFVILAFAGALLIIKPTFANAALLPSISGAVSGVMAGAAYACVRGLKTRKVSNALIITAFSGFSCLASIPFMIADFEPFSLYQFVMLILAGAFAAIAQFSITASYSYAEASYVSVYGYSQILFTSIIGIFFMQYPDKYSVLGYIIICFAAIISYVIEMKKGGKQINGAEGKK